MPTRERVGSSASASSSCRYSDRLDALVRRLIFTPALAGLMQRILFLVLTCLFVAQGAAAPLAPSARAEIDALMSRLESSACEFRRNGTWHTAAEAKSHLLRKLKVLEDRGAVQSTEQFIELAASNSSLSGQPYLVRCGNDAPVRSGTWLRSQLQDIRAHGRAGSAPSIPVR